ncbi:OLC1v1031563C1 [Oldenlandia corymbosa var. corymbosa]|uniref:OLC1v1031563C1 n=1 Tax=Oldenlandia corymbosa var. corymbosa TaxID=529605 RepID=A0AAV1CJ40_OLDCO|nr:OLC1v1031563C1 [Oldenlandia corymbosa var. corymbosa]
MAKILIPLVALFLIASYASGTTLQEICKGTSDAKYCEGLLKRTVNKSTTFKSKELKKMVIDRALIKVKFAIAYAIKRSNPKGPTYKVCINFLSQATSLIAKGNLIDAQSYVTDCANSLDDTAAETLGVKKLVDDASKATLVVGDIVRKV